MLGVEPAGPLHDGIQAAVVDGLQDPLVGSILLLPGANQQVSERARGQVRLLGQEEDLVQGRTDDSPFSVRPDPGRRPEQGDACDLVRPVTSTPRPARDRHRHVGQERAVVPRRPEREPLVGDPVTILDRLDPRPIDVPLSRRPPRARSAGR